jgi:ABC-type sugar transport system permease subunit
MSDRPSRSAYAFLAFPLFILMLFVFIPTVAGMGLSFCEWSGGGEPRFVGLQNYAQAMHDSAFWPALRNTLLFSLVTVPITVVAGFLLAAAVHARWFVGRTAVRTLLFLPSVLSIVAIGFIWRWVLDPQAGLLNALLIELGVPRDRLPQWLGNSPVALATIMGVSIWRNLGFAVVLYLAALSDVPRSYYDAAAVDGAGPWRTLWNVTWPVVSPMTFFLFITGFIGALQVFDLVLVMIGTVQQDWTDVLNLYLYREFSRNRLGYAAMLGSVVLWLTAVITIAQWLWHTRGRREGAR